MASEQLKHLVELFASIREREIDEWLRSRLGLTGLAAE
jgi:hypothetical protein